MRPRDKLRGTAVTRRGYVIRMSIHAFSDLMHRAALLVATHPGRQQTFHLMRLVSLATLVASCAAPVPTPQSGPSAGPVVPGSPLASASANSETAEQNHSPALDGTSKTIAFAKAISRIEDAGAGGPLIRFNSDIYTVGVDGSNQRRLTDSLGTKGWPSWSPDGRQIVYRWAPEGFDWNNSDIAIVTVADMQVTTLAHQAWSPAWSPNGDWIAYYSASDRFGLNLIRPDGSEDHQILAGDAEYPAWSPDGRRLAFMSLGFPAGSSSADYDLYVVDADGRNLERLTNIAGEDGWPAWSHDGTRLAYEHRPTEAESEIHVMMADGKGDQRISDSTDNLQEGDPSWSPDDGYLVYYASTLTEIGGLFVMHPDGSGRLKIGSDGSDPAWKPVP